MRIVGGDLRGRKLAVPKGSATRPTTDRNRETLFNILSHSYRDQLNGQVLDLFAGTGALGCEALSRGAAHCIFVENAAGARALIQTNIETFGLTGRTRLLRRDATKLGARDSLPASTLVFADPPYNRELGTRAAAQLVEHDWIAPDGLLVLEEARAAMPHTLPGFARVDLRETGETAFGFFIRAT